MNGGYGIVRQEVMRDKTLSAEAKCIYAYLSSLAGNDGYCYPSIDTMIKELNMSRNRIARHMSQLISAGIIVKDRTRNENLLSRNTYRISSEIRDTRYTQNEALENEALENEALENEATTINNTTNNNTTNNNTTTLPNPSQRGRSTRARKKSFKPPTSEEVDEYCRERGYECFGTDFCNHYTANGWMAGRSHLVDWKAKADTWANKRKTEKSDSIKSKSTGNQGNQFTNFTQRQYDYSALESRMLNLNNKAVEQDRTDQNVNNGSS